MTARYLIGDVFDVMAKLPDGSVDAVITSPPFLALRSYLPADHPDKAKEIGSERTPAEFVDTMLRLTAEWRRLLAPHGSICVELGDVYSGSGGAGGDYLNAGMRAGQPAFDGSAARNRALTRAETYDGGASDRHDFAKPGTRSRAASGSGWPMAKSLALTPELYRVALAYGINPLTGEKSPAGMWRVRNNVDVVRPNPPVGALGDKVRPATSDLVMATIASDRFFDLEAIRDESGAPPLDWWVITGAGYRGAHYAVWPPELLVRPIKAMCPERVCRKCGKPSRRIVETTQVDTGRTTNGTKPRDRAESFAGSTYETRTLSHVETVGWTDCGHGQGCRPTVWTLAETKVVQGRRGRTWIDLDEWDGDDDPVEIRTKVKRKRVVSDLGNCNDGSHWRPGVILDPFAGSGTTLMVATGHGRDAIGIDLDARNADLARERVGMLLEVEEEM